MGLKPVFNPFTSKFDWVNEAITNPLIFKGAISVNTDFPLIADVKNGWFYTVTSDVTDNAGVTYTNTGDSFEVGDEIAWNGVDWTIMGNENVFLRLDCSNDPLTGDLESLGDAEIRSSFIGGWSAANTYAVFTHKDLKAVDDDYALMQSPAGKTFLNSKSGQVISFRTDNSEKVTIDGSNLKVVGGGHMYLVGDNKYYYAGASSDMAFGFDGTIARFRSDMVAPSDFYIETGAGKSVVVADGDLSIPNDSAKLLLGAAQDASIYYNGTDLVINPQEVGTGAVFIDGVAAAGIQEALKISGGAVSSGGGVSMGYYNAYNSSWEMISTTAKYLPALGSWGGEFEILAADTGLTADVSVLKANKLGITIASGGGIFGAGDLQLDKTGTNTTFGAAANNHLALGGPTSTGANKYNQIAFGYGGLTGIAAAVMGYQTTDFGGQTKGDLVFGTRNVTTASEATERMRIKSDGKVGIGTDTPSQLLDVDGNIMIGAGNMFFKTTSNYVAESAGDFWYRAAGDHIFFAGGYNEALRIDSTRDIYIPNDDKKLLFGAAQDSSITYNGTDMVIDPREVGTGDLLVKGDARFESNGVTDLYVEDTSGSNAYLYFRAQAGVSAQLFAGTGVPELDIFTIGNSGQIELKNTGEVYFSSGQVRITDVNGALFFYDNRPIHYGTGKDFYSVYESAIDSYVIGTDRNVGAERKFIMDSAGTIETTSGRVRNTTRVTTTYTVLVTDDRVFANTDGGDYTITLPAGVDGQEFRIVNCGTSGNTLTIAPNGAEKIIGVNSSITADDSETIILTFESVEGWY